MRKYKSAIILLVVFAVLLGGYFAYDKFLKKPPEDPFSTSETDMSNYQSILKGESDKLKSVEIDNKGEKFLFEQKDKKLVLSEPQNINVNPTIISSLSYAATSLTSSKVLKDVTDLSQFGLTAPQATVKVTMEDATVQTMLIGDMSPSGAYYVKKTDDDTVYTISSYDAEKFLISTGKIKDKTLFTFKPEEVNYIALEKKGVVSFVTKSVDQGDWNITQPIELEGDVSRLQPIIEAALGLTIKEFVKSPGSLSDYGLDEPNYVIELGAKDQVNMKLLLGKELVRGKEVYAKLADGNDIFILNQEAFTFGDKTVIDVMSRFVYIVNINKVTKMEITGRGKTHTFIINTGEEDDKDDDKFYALDKQTEDKAFRNFYQAVIGLLAGQVKLDETPSGTAEVTTLYHQKDTPSLVKVEYIPRDAHTYHVVKDGQYKGLVISRDAVKLMLDAIDVIEASVK